MHSLAVACLVPLVAGGAPAGAQERPKLSLPADRGDVQYHFQLRAIRGGPALRELAGDQVAAGGGFMAMFGGMPLRLRIRMDGDAFPASSGKQTVWTAGLGAEAVFLFPSSDTLEPYVSLGPAFQHWEIGDDSVLPGAPRHVLNKVAGRLEAGLWFRGRFSLSCGLFWGELEGGRSASNPYAALTFRF